MQQIFIESNKGVKTYSNLWGKHMNVTKLSDISEWKCKKCCGFAEAFQTDSVLVLLHAWIYIYVTYVSLASKYDFWDIQIWGSLFVFHCRKLNVVKDSVERCLFNWIRLTLPIELCFVGSTLFDGVKKHSNSWVNIWMPLS